MQVQSINLHSGMEETGNDRFWELATGKIHAENNPEEEIELERLLKGQENQKLFSRLQNIRSGLDKVKTLNEITQDRSWGDISRYFRKNRIRVVMTIARYAAVILIAFLAGNYLRTSHNLDSGPARQAEISVPLGQMSEIILYDGTHVWLNSGTTLKYTDNFGEKERSITLDGEAFFKVKHHRLPFRVKLKNSEIEVLGTSFNVVSYPGEQSSQVTLVEGSLRINSLSGAEIATLNPSQQITIPENTEDICLHTVDVGFYSSWTEGKIVFEEERLSDVAVRLERWYNVKIRFEDQEAGNLRFSGTILKNKPFDQIVKAFQLLLPININYQNNLEQMDIITISKQ
jgi:ferric-dicitrate binding protein FerR (iron transport regulator)